MGTLSLRIPESLHERARRLSEREGIPLNQLIVTALAEKVATLGTVGYLEQRARRGSLETFLRTMDRVPDGVSLEW